MTKQLGVVIFAALAVLGGIVFYLGSGAYNVGADTPHWEITRKLIEIVRSRSIEVRARQIELPNLQNEQLVLKGAGQYATMCVNCHLSPGQMDSEIRTGLYPKPPNLSEQRFDPRAVFWVTKHGLKMSGMPAWGLEHDDATLWSIVVFVTRLPDLSAEDYKGLVAKAPPDQEMESMRGGGQEPGKAKKSGFGMKTKSKDDHEH